MQCTNTVVVVVGIPNFSQVKSLHCNALSLFLKALPPRLTGRKFEMTLSLLPEEQIAGNHFKVFGRTLANTRLRIFLSCALFMA